MEIQKAIKIKINEEIYNLSNVSTFFELKKNIMFEFDLIISNFVTDQGIISDKLNPNDYENIIGIVDKYEYERLGEEENEYFRCNSCRQTISAVSLKCKHTSKCRSRIYRNAVSDTLSLRSDRIDSEVVFARDFDDNSSINEFAKLIKTQEFETSTKKNNVTMDLDDTKLKTPLKQNKTFSHFNNTKLSKTYDEKINNTFLNSTTNESAIICDQIPKDTLDISITLQPIYKVDPKKFNNDPSLTLSMRIMISRFIKKLKLPLKFFFFQMKQHVKRIIGAEINDKLKKFLKRKRDRCNGTYINVFRTNNKYPCEGCDKWIIGKNFHRHIDECGKSFFDKEFCQRCRRDCVMKVVDMENGVIVHEHKCMRKIKLSKFSKTESLMRKHRKLKEKKKRGPRKWRLESRPTASIFNTLFLRQILDSFVNEKRYKRIEYFKSLKEGNPAEYLDMFYSENYSLDFRSMFNQWIAYYGRFLGDEEIDRVSFTLEKAPKVTNKYSETFLYLKGHSTENEEEIKTDGLKAARAFIMTHTIPKHRKIIIKSDIFLTYLLACAKRREIDIELGISDEFGRKIAEEPRFFEFKMDKDYMKMLLNLCVPNFPRIDEDQIRKIIENSRNIGCFIQNKLVGSLTFKKLKIKKLELIYVSMLAVELNCRNKGIGRKLLKFVESICDKIVLWADENAKKFYQKMEFRKCSNVWYSLQTLIPYSTSSVFSHKGLRDADKLYIKEWWSTEKVKLAINKNF